MQCLYSDMWSDISIREDGNAIHHFHYQNGLSIVDRVYPAFCMDPIFQYVL